MPVDEQTVATLVDAARLSTAQLDSLSQGVLGASVKDISSASTPAEQARDMVTYARQYGLLRELASAIIYYGADRAGLQNLILGDEHMEPAGGKQDTSGLYERLRMEQKLDTLITESQRNTAQLSRILEQQAQFDRRISAVEAYDKRIVAIESNSPKPVPLSDKVLFIMFAVVLTALFAFNVLSRMQ